MLRIIWKAGCLETCTSGLGLGPGCNSPAYTTCVLTPEMANVGVFANWLKLWRAEARTYGHMPEG